MKQIYLLTITFLICNFGFTANAQSVTFTKMLDYLKNQQQTTINTDLIKIGFTFNNKKEIPNMLEYSYYKKGSNFTEKINIVSNDEIFSVVYGPEKSYFTTMKEIMLTKQFVYVYSNKNNKYYENTNMRIGINDELGIISFFVKLN